MKSPFVRDLKPNDLTTGIFLVQSKEIRQKKTGDPYLSLILSDRSGDMEAKMWDGVAEVMGTFERDDFVKVRGIAQLYNNRLQFTIQKVRPVEMGEVDPADFFPASLRDPEEMWSELRGIVSGLTNHDIRQLLNLVLDDPEIAPKFKFAPAAKSIHHAFRSGLLEHVLSLAGLAKAVAQHYKTLDLDLLLAGVVLHDIGKIYELSFDRAFGYTVEGQLLGHISIAIRMLGDKFRELPNFPPQLRNLIEHLVLSHHGKYEFGSPRLPVFTEAIVLHYIDDLDSKVECMRVLVDKEPLAEGLFTAYSPSMERSALRKDRYWNPEGDSTPSPSAPAPAPEPAIAAAPAPHPAKDSVFGSKLQLALGKE